MKKCLLFLIMFVFILSCSENFHYIKKDSLPKKTKYYNSSEKYVIKVSKFWHYLPIKCSNGDDSVGDEKIIGEDAEIIGEIAVAPCGKNRRSLVYSIGKISGKGYIFLLKDSAEALKYLNNK
jgi:hypothetical protein